MQTTEDVNEPKDAYSTSGSSPPPQNKIDKLWGGRGYATSHWTGVPHLLTRHLGDLGMTPAEFALVLALMSHKGKEDPWLANKTLARYLGMTSRGVQGLIARCEGRWLRRVTRRTEDGRQLSNKFDLTPLFDRLEALSVGARPPDPKIDAPQAAAGSCNAAVGAERDLGNQWSELTIDSKDASGITLASWIITAFEDVMAELKLPMSEGPRRAIGRKVAAKLTREQIAAAADAFGEERLRRIMGGEDGTSFSAFAAALVDEHARPWLTKKAEARPSAESVAS